MDELNATIALDYHSHYADEKRIIDFKDIHGARHIMHFVEYVGIDPLSETTIENNESEDQLTEIADENPVG